MTEKALTLADQVLQQIQKSIITGELEAGSKINEQSIAAKYGISRGPTREALQILERQRLVVKAPHVGARVAQLSINELNELYQLRSVLEGMACELTAARITSSQLAELQALLDKQKTALAAGDFDFQQQSELDFHYLIIQICGNRHLQDTLLSSLYYLIRMYRFQTSDVQRPTNAITEHQNIVNAIADNDGELANLLMRRHIEKGRRSTELKLKELIK
ncbi:MAG: GntR family transcriptional regulator [Parashewanella sp.]